MFKTLDDIYKSNKKITIFDIGAHTFSDSLEFKAKCPEADVYAFEPDTYNLSTFAQRARDAGIVVCEHAFGDEDAEVKFFPSESFKGAKWTASGSIVEPVTKENSSEGISHEGLLYNLDGYKVECKTIQTFCKEMDIDRVDYMHIDTQGAEYRILRNLGDIRPFLIMAETSEYTNYKTGITVEIFDDLMTSLGYSILQRFDFDTLYTHSSNV